MATTPHFLYSVVPVVKVSGGEQHVDRTTSHALVRTRSQTGDSFDTENLPGVPLISDRPHNSLRHWSSAMSCAILGESGRTSPSSAFTRFLNTTTAVVETDFGTKILEEFRLIAPATLPRVSGLIDSMSEHCNLRMKELPDGRSQSLSYRRQFQRHLYIVKCSPQGSSMGEELHNRRKELRAAQFTRLIFGLLTNGISDARQTDTTSPYVSTKVSEFIAERRRSVRAFLGRYITFHISFLRKLFAYPADYSSESPTKHSLNASTIRLFRYFFCFPCLQRVWITGCGNNAPITATSACSCGNTALGTAAMGFPISKILVCFPFLQRVWITGCGNNAPITATSACSCGNTALGTAAMGFPLSRVLVCFPFLQRVWITGCGNDAPITAASACSCGNTAPITAASACSCGNTAPITAASACSCGNTALGTAAMGFPLSRVLVCFPFLQRVWITGCGNNAPITATSASRGNNAPVTAARRFPLSRVLVCFPFLQRVWITGCGNNAPITATSACSCGNTAL
eukprot:284818163_3